MTPPSENIESLWPHRWAVALVCATFPLIWVGGLVTSTKSGMAVPDWPTTYGYNLFLYPWQTWLFGPFDLFIEHGHRLLGAFTGMVTIALVVSTFWSDKRTWMRWASIVALLLVIIQGVLGGMRVRLDQQLLAMLHGCLGSLFFSYSVAMAVMSSSWWKHCRSANAAATSFATASAENTEKRRIHRLAFLAVAFTYLQIVIGAQIRHAAVDLSPRVFQLFVAFHLFMAAAVLVHVILLARAIRDGFREQAFLSVPAQCMVGLTFVQVVLGVGSWMVRRGWPSWFSEWSIAQSYVVRSQSWEYSLVPTAHTALGSLILALGVMLYLRSKRAWRMTATVAGSGLVLAEVA